MLLTVKDFARMCSVTVPGINASIKNNRLKQTAAGLIDTDEKLNSLYLRQKEIENQRAAVLRGDIYSKNDDLDSDLDVSLDIDEVEDIDTETLNMSDDELTRLTIEEKRANLKLKAIQQQMNQFKLEVARGLYIKKEDVRRSAMVIHTVIQSQANGLTSQAVRRVYDMAVSGADFAVAQHEFLKFLNMYFDDVRDEIKKHYD